MRPGPAVLWTSVLLGALSLGCASRQAVTPPTKAAAVLPSNEVDSNKVVYEVTIGVPVPNLGAAVAWYTKLLGRDVESMEPVEGVVELRVASGAWLQLFAVDAEQFQPSKSVLRFKTPDIDAEAARLALVGIQAGEIVRVPEVVEFAEFADPYGNPVSLYDVE